MRPLSEDLRKRIVDHYKTESDATYRSTAEHFRVGEATVSRLLRLVREVGDVVAPKVPRARMFKVDLEWLEQNARASPDARLRDRVEDYAAQRGVQVGVTAMWSAMNALGWTHKKRRSSPASGSPRAFRR